MPSLKSVLDTNITVALVHPLPYSQAVDRLYSDLRSRESHLFLSPSFWRYEAISVVRNLVFLRLINRQQGLEMLDLLLAMPVTISDPPELWKQSFLWAERIQQSKIYDAAFLAFSQLVGARFYTADERLFHAAQQAGADFIELVK